MAIRNACQVRRGQPQVPGAWAPETSSVEALLEMGVLFRFLLRHGADLDQLSQESGRSRRLVLLALVFAAAPEVLKLRALVERWNTLRILTGIRKEFSGS